MDEAVEALQRADQYKDVEGYPAWTAAWLNGEINMQQGYVQEAVENFEAALNYRSESTVKRKFDFSKDYVVLNRLGEACFELSKTKSGEKRLQSRIDLLKKSAEQFQRALEIDSENVESHYQLSLVFRQLAEFSEGETQNEFKELAAMHTKLHFKYKPDESATAVAIRKARDRYPWGREASQGVVFYHLNRDDAFELPPKKKNDSSDLEKIE